MINDPTLQVGLCVGLEKIINKALQYDPGSRHALARLTGSTLALELTQPVMTFFICPEENGIRLHSAGDDNVTARIKGSPFALLSLMNSNQLNLSGTGVEVFGNTGFIIELQRVLKNLDIDWEEAVSEIVGDIAGHEIGRSITGLQSWLQQRKQSFDRLLGEFLTEEVNVTPSKVELDFFNQQVDELRLGVDRLTARLQSFSNKEPRQS